MLTHFGAFCNPSPARVPWGARPLRMALLWGRFGDRAWCSARSRGLRTGWPLLGAPRVAPVWLASSGTCLPWTAHAPAALHAVFLAGRRLPSAPSAFPHVSGGLHGQSASAIAAPAHTAVRSLLSPWRAHACEQKVRALGRRGGCIAKKDLRAFESKSTCFGEHEVRALERRDGCIAEKDLRAFGRKRACFGEK